MALMLAAPVLDELACERCAQADSQDGDIHDIAKALARVSLDLKRVQSALRPIVTARREAANIHLRCALCGILAGPGHLEPELQVEPLASKADSALEVCPSCARHLERFKRTVAAQRKKSAQIAVMDARDSADDAEPADVET